MQRTEFIGSFKEGYRHGKCKQVNDNGSSLDAMWKMDKRHEKAIYTDEKGKVSKLKYKDDKLI